MNPQNSSIPPSVGSLIKKIMEINPDFHIHDVIEMIRKSTRIREGKNEGFGSRQIVDENLALDLARGHFESLKAYELREPKL